MEARKRCVSDVALLMRVYGSKSHAGPSSACFRQNLQTYLQVKECLYRSAYNEGLLTSYDSLGMKQHGYAHV